MKREERIELEIDITNIVKIVNERISKAVAVKDFIQERLSVLKENDGLIAEFVRRCGSHKMEVNKFTSTGMTDEMFLPGQKLIADCILILPAKPEDEKQVQAKLKYMWDEIFEDEKRIHAGFQIGSIEDEKVMFKIFID